MKKLFLIFLFPALLLGQSTINANRFKLRGGSPILNRSYRIPMHDTTGWLDNLQYKKLWFNVQSSDTARFLFSYQVGNDTTYFTPATALDSLVTTSTIGDAKTLDVTSKVGGFQFIRFIIKNDTLTVTDSVRTFDNNGDSIGAVTYTANMKDTTQWLNFSAYSSATLYLHSLDSARATITYQVANDTTVVISSALFDSLSTTSNTGAEDSYVITTYYQLHTYIRFIISFLATGQGTTSNTYSAYYRRIAFGSPIGTYTAGYKQEK